MKLIGTNISKRYDSTLALDDVSFSIEDAQIVGIVGKNGAGKSTLLKIILDILPSDTGTVRFSFPDGSERAPRDISLGFLPEERGLYLNCTVKDQLLLFAQLNGLPKQDALVSIEKYLQLFDVPEYLNVKIKKLSKGNKQKIQLISALVHEPSLIILDEPFSGLDPINAQHFATVVKECKREGRIVVFSSHRLEDIESMCDSILFMNKGTIPLQGTVGEIKQQFDCDRYQLNTADPIDDLLTRCAIHATKSDDLAPPHAYLIQEPNDQKLSDLLQLITTQGIRLLHFEKILPSIKDIFISQFGEDTNEK